jgi:hypothetical protein
MRTLSVIYTQTQIESLFVFVTCLEMQNARKEKLRKKKERNEERN